VGKQACQRLADELTLADDDPPDLAFDLDRTLREVVRRQRGRTRRVRIERRGVHFGLRMGPAQIRRVASASRVE